MHSTDTDAFTAEGEPTMPWRIVATVIDPESPERGTSRNVARAMTRAESIRDLVDLLDLPSVVAGDVRLSVYDGWELVAGLGTHDENGDPCAYPVGMAALI